MSRIGPLPTGGFITLEQRLLSDADVRASTEERRHLVDTCWFEHRTAFCRGSPT